MFTGREYDAETGLYYYRARSYSPQIGRFLQTDPIGAYDENRYTYCYNNPVNLVDPYGLVAIGVGMSQPIGLPEINDLRGTKKIDGSYDTTSFSKKAKENAKGKDNKEGKEDEEDWEKGKTTTEPAKGKKYKGGKSEETEYINKKTGERKYLHRIINKNGKVVHNHERYPKQ